MNIALQIYWITILMGVLSAILKIKSNKLSDPFKAMKDMQESMADLPNGWADKCSNLIDWAFNNAPFSIYIIIATLSTIPIINLVYVWTNIKDLMFEDDGH